MKRRLAQVSADLFFVALFVGGEIEVWTSFDRVRLASSLFWAPLSTLPLLSRRRSGLVPALVVVGTGVVFEYVHYTEEPVGFLAFVSALFVVGLHEPRPRAIAGGLACYAGGLAMFSRDPTGFTAADVITMTGFAFVPLTGGIVMRERAERAAELEEQARHLERARDEAERLAVAEERAEIAGELQRLIARAVETMTAQAEAASALVEKNPDWARAPIEAVEEAGRAALAETRRLLGVLRRDLSEREAPT